MHLVPCATPAEPLETAPRTALLADLTEGESWEGFWSSDVYYVRRTTAAGEVSWYEVADDVQESRSANAANASESSDSRVLTLRPKTRRSSRVALIFAKSPSGRRMLVGSGRRSPR
jgi:hypothetical protein